MVYTMAVKPGSLPKREVGLGPRLGCILDSRSPSKEHMYVPEDILRDLSQKRRDTCIWELCFINNNLDYIY